VEDIIARFDAAIEEENIGALLNLMNGLTAANVEVLEIRGVLIELLQYDEVSVRQAAEAALSMQAETCSDELYAAIRETDGDEMLFPHALTIAQQFKALSKPWIELLTKDVRHQRSATRERSRALLKKHGIDLLARGSAAA